MQYINQQQCTTAQCSTEWSTVHTYVGHCNYAASAEEEKHGLLPAHSSPPPPVNDNDACVETVDSIKHCA